MTEKRFRVQEHCLRSSYGIEAENWLVTNDNHGVALNDKAEAHMVANMCNDVIDVLNEQHEQIKLKNKEISNAHHTIREQHELLNKQYEENEQLKQFKEYVFDLIDKEIKETKEIFEDGKIDLMTYNASMITLTGLKEQLKGDME